MTEVYASDEYLAEKRARPAPPLADRVRGAAALARVMWFAQPMLRGVFLAPMEKTDPQGRRMREAFKRMQLLSRKPTVARLPFIKFMLWMQDLLTTPVGKRFKTVLLRIMGADERAVAVLFTDEELARAQKMSFDDLAEDALAAKFQA
jgi:hypothetical protein